MIRSQSFRRIWPKSLGGKVVAVGTGLAGLVVVLWVVAYVATERRLTRAETFADHFGLPRSYEELVGPPIDPARNAAVPLQEAAAIAGEEVAKSPDHRAGSYGVGVSALDDPASLFNNERYESLVQQADERPQYRSLAASEEFPAYASYRGLMEGCHFASAELAISRWLIEQGRFAAGAARLVRLQRLARKWGDKEPTIWSAIIRENVENCVCHQLGHLLLRRVKLPPAAYEAIEEELAQSIDYPRAVLWALQAEKLEVLGYCEDYSWSQGVFVFQPLRNLDKLYALDYFNRSMMNMTLSLADMRAAQLRLEEQDKGRRGEALHRWLHPISSRYLPSLENLVVEPRYPMVMARCTRIVNAMARRGDFTAPLGSLGLSTECLVDPFDGKLLRVKYAKEGPAVYSVGRNLVDDGGTFTDVRDVGLGLSPHRAKQ